MNQQQREFLIKQVEKTCEKQLEELKSQIPDKPSLNNYLIASFLDNTIKFADIETLKKKMRTTVLKFGKSDILVTEDNDDYYSRRNKRDKNMVNVVAEDLFVIPKNYLEALKEYEEKKKAIELKIKQLENTRETIILKLQIGSATTLDKLVMQVDNMGDLNLMNTQLLIGEIKEKK